MKVMIAIPLENDKEITKQLIVDNQSFLENMPDHRGYQYWGSISK